MTTAIIGTAGRDRSKPMPRHLWHWMVVDAITRVPQGAHVVSGGAAWADHLAVMLFLSGNAARLTLHLPALFAGGRFDGPMFSSGSAANHYHRQFSQVVGFDSLHQVATVLAMPGVDWTFEPTAPGYGAMMARNLKVAQAPNLLAYTFGRGDEPADGGTAHTWRACAGLRVHVPLPIYA